MVPVAADQEQTADRRADRHAEVGRDAHRGVGHLLPLGRDEIGDHRLVGGIPQRAERRQQGEEREAEIDVAAGQDQPERHERLEAPAREDERPPPDAVRPVSADVADDAGEDRADQVREREPRLGGVQRLDRPDPEERVRGRAGDRAGERDREDGPQRSVDVYAPDEAEDAGQELHDARRVRETAR